MPLKIVVTAFVLAVTPALAMAQCAGSHATPTDRQAMSCLPGTAWDEATGTCVPDATS
jgi:hypothetical protein